MPLKPLEHYPSSTQKFKHSKGFYFTHQAITKHLDIDATKKSIETCCLFCILMQGIHSLIHISEKSCAFVSHKGEISGYECSERTHRLQRSPIQFCFPTTYYFLIFCTKIVRASFHSISFFWWIAKPLTISISFH